MNESFSLSRNKRFLVVVLALGLAAMLVTSLLEQTRHVSIQEVASTPDPGHSPEQHSDMGAMGNIGALMEQAGKNPDDPALLLRLAEALMHAQKWDAAAMFAGRAIALRPNDPQPLYLLGIVEHSRGKHRESADLLEKVLALQDDPSVLYSLGMQYLH
ncbi:MAG: hypothetical protein Q4F27_06460 [Desulfovibrionaceae bacterium]|nr:hypothetical protein [Desulfovibrionaceae bacterium]